MSQNNHNLSQQNLIWIDLEMTGLDPQKERIIEIATIVTDKDLNILAEGPVLAIHQSDELLSKMSDWCVKTHTANGLVERVKQSKLTERAAELQTISFLKQWVQKGVSPICGNSVAQDKRFLYRYMPDLAEYFHYRHLDVSTLKELASRWKPDILKQFEKKNTHLALDDIRESIEELKFYRTHFIQL
ncbi:oligoribonuclease [Pasteurella atlantica]|uniref:oligoribonuclease n=1 Tax=Pasteurellaceae TaxID=712 RepID=UPI00277801D1|nr:oligoribonuclease [Pasteurella atlantica]MDP8033125.1 oligoribonuclease [Pasteurella atlantica]MDP8035062.1 oligoribonuclease [Pasteurella atlantica]MDP8036978.1 oligoribonuclease [Pasteurella atlantica]MDP8047496.1 oligoribonuclease [Pasteurella atlantica]MDP8049165.1 oligoribonuclease [Pasteurella atlantica]